MSTTAQTRKALAHAKSMAKLKREIPLYIMCLPAIIVVLIYSYGPMLGLGIAFQNFVPTKGLFGSKWVGLSNFRVLFALPDWFQVIWNTVFISFMKMVGGIVVPVFYALLLNEVTQSKFKRLFQTMVYLPNFLSWVILSGILMDILSPADGIVNRVITSLGFEPIFFLGNAKVFPYTMAITDIWKGFGFGTVVYLASLTSIDPGLYEAATIDGAGRWRQTIHVTLPGIKGIVVLMTVLSMGNILNGGFEQIFNMYSPSVYSTGDILDTMIYRMGIVETRFAISTAAGFFKSIISMIFVSLSYLLADRWAGYRVF